MLIHYPTTGINLLVIYERSTMMDKSVKDYSMLFLLNIDLYMLSFDFGTYPISLKYDFSLNMLTVRYL